MKIRCPECREKVQPGAVRCRHCHRNFNEEYIAYSRHALLAERVFNVVVLIAMVWLAFKLFDWITIARY